MERVGILIERLQEQYQQHADNYYLIVTAQMLLTELQQQQKVADAGKKVAVIMPAAIQPMNHTVAGNNNIDIPAKQAEVSNNTIVATNGTIEAKPVQEKNQQAEAEV